MSGGNQDYYRGLPITAAIGAYLLVKDNGLGQWALCTAGQAPDGLMRTVSDATMATLTPAFTAPGEILMRGKIREMQASGAITAYAPVYTDVGGAITAVNTGYKVGYALEAATANLDVISVYWDPAFVPVVSALTAPTAALAGQAAEVVMATITFQPNTLAAGDVIDLDALFVGSGNSTDTTQVRIRLNGLTGTVIADTTAVASVAAATPGSLLGRLVVEVLGAGSAGKIDGGSQAGFFKAAAPPVSAGRINVDTTLAITVVLTLIHGSSNVGNTTVANQFTARRLRQA